MDIAVTKQMISAVCEGAIALRDRANELERDPQVKLGTSVGLILRHNIELARQQADLLSGFANRCATLLQDKSSD